MISTDGAYNIAIESMNMITSNLNTLLKAYSITGKLVYYETAQRIHRYCMLQMNNFKLDTINGKKN